MMMWKSSKVAKEEILEKLPKWHKKEVQVTRRHWFPSSICLPLTLCLLSRWHRKQTSYCSSMGQAPSLVKFEKESQSALRRVDVRVEVEKNV